MLVRIRLSHGPRIRRKRGSKRRLALGFATLLTPVAIAASVLTIWRLAADMNLAREFAIRDGLFSHWQVWLVVSIVLIGAAFKLTQYGNSGASGEAGNPGSHRAGAAGNPDDIAAKKTPIAPSEPDADESSGIYGGAGQRADTFPRRWQA